MVIFTDFTKKEFDELISGSDMVERCFYVDRTVRQEFADDMIDDSDVYVFFDELEIIVTGYLLRFNIPPYLDAYRYLRDGIMLKISKGDSFVNLNNDIYPYLDKKYRTGVNSIEKAIRCALKNRITDEILEDYKEFCGYRVKGDRISSSEFICTISEKIRMEAIKNRKIIV